MSGHTNYTIWITHSADYVIIDGQKEKILDTFFTSSPVHNSDNFIIKTTSGCYQLGEHKSGVDWEELVERYKQ